MLLYPHSDANSDDDRLALLADPDLAKRLRKANPKFFTRNGHGSIAKILALAGIVSLVAGYVIEPAVLATHRTSAPFLTTTVQHVAPAQPHVLKRHEVASVAHAKTVVVVAPKVAAVPKVVVAPPEPAPQLQPKKQVQRGTRVVTVAEPQPNAQNEERFWLKAQAEARAKDQMRAKAAAITAATESAAQDRAVQAPPKATIDTGTAAKINMPQGPVNSPPAPSPVNQPWPNLPGGGPCTPGRGPIIVGHGITGVLINAVLQSAIPIHHSRPFGRP